MCDDCKNKMELTKTQYEFIGMKFPTPRGGILTVTGVARNEDRSIIKVGSQPKFTIDCNICSQDKELFPNEFLSTRVNIVNGSFPCGCSITPQWKEQQYIVRVKRVCEERGYVFLGWFGEYKGSKTHLNLYNPETDNQWNTNTINSFLQGNGDPAVKNIKTSMRLKVEDSVHIAAFMATNSFPKDSIFYRNTTKPDTHGRYYLWNYVCPICSVDEYTENGLCDGVFTSTITSLKNGRLPCRCSKSYHWSQDQREYQIDKICKEEGLRFIKWEDGFYKDKNSRFFWYCKEGCSSCTTVNGFLRGCRCMGCYLKNRKNSGEYYGYYPDRVYEKDYLYVIKFNNEYIKVGRSFDISKRIKGSVGLLKSSGMSIDQLTILKTCTATHQEVYECEQWIHEELNERGFYHEASDWTTETFDIDSEQLIYKLLQESDLVETNILEN